MPPTSKPDQRRTIPRRSIPHSGALRLDIEDRVLDALRRIETIATLLNARADRVSPDFKESTVVAEAAEMIAEESRRIRKAITD